MKKFILKKRDNSNKNNYIINYKKELNSAQYDAVMHNTGPALVLAGAGTGKTRTMVYRVARLIEDGIAPEKILLLTFTRKSSKEMLSRATKLLDGRVNKVSGGTFHSFALQTLKIFHKSIGLNQNFSLIDQSDSEDALSIVRTEFINNHNKYKKKKRFPNKSILSAIRSKSINKRDSIEQIILNEYQAFTDEIIEIEWILDEYSKYKNRSNLLDYDDLLLLLLKALNDSNVSDEISKRYKYILIDEYQDTNRIQHEISLKLAGREANLMAVGDDAQSIYSFRGAEHNNIIFFPKSFDTCTIYKIEENFRSLEPILKFTNKLIEESPISYKKRLFANREGGEKPYIITAKDERQQSEFITQQILESREEGIDLNEIAILYRSNFLSIDLEIELSKSNIPYKKYGGLKFIETAHVKDMIAYLKLVNNFNDLISWNRILGLIKGIGPKTISKITELVDKNSLNFNNYQQLLSEFRNKHRIFETFSMIASLSLNDKPDQLLEKISINYSDILKEKYSDSEKRSKDIEIMIQIASTYNTLDSFLSDMALDPPNSSVEDILPTDNESEFVTLSTIHSAKGLEWKKVFLVWALDGRLPSVRSNSIDDIEEERRLFYVASTRAKDDLFVSYPINIFDRQTGFVLSKPSRFLDNISEDLAARFTLVEEV
ncbi:ATP-dependent helicase [Candidatus Kapabacteria bacterium]|nr:ATP-dependent helicase [Candidatus Kapabacteria bacterium]